MSYLEEFKNCPPITVPLFLTHPPFEDHSWHNDGCPRFGYVAKHISVWVDWDDPTYSEAFVEGEEYFRYTVMVSYFDADGCFTDEEGDNYTTLFQTNSAFALARFLLKYKSPRSEA
jgi:hypothetical protein